MRFIKNLIIVVSLVLPGFASASTEADARNFVQKVGDQVMVLLDNKSIASNQKQNQLEKIFENTVDINWIARFAIGKNWRSMSEDQKADYLQLYRNYIIASYVPNFKKYTQERFEIKQIKPGDPDEFMVDTIIIRPNGQQPLRISYNIRADESGSFKIFDIIAEGVSLIVTQRSEFGSIIQKQGIDYLNDQLEKKIALANKN